MNTGSRKGVFGAVSRSRDSAKARVAEGPTVHLRWLTRAGLAALLTALVIAGSAGPATARVSNQQRANVNPCPSPYYLHAVGFATTNCGDGPGSPTCGEAGELPPMSVVGQGKIVLPPPGHPIHCPGEIWQLGAQADPGWSFYSWSSGPPCDGAATCAVTFERHDDVKGSITATFCPTGSILPMIVVHRIRPKDRLPRLRLTAAAATSQPHFRPFLRQLGSPSTNGHRTGSARSRQTPLAGSWGITTLRL